MEQDLKNLKESEKKPQTALIATAKKRVPFGQDIAAKFKSNSSTYFRPTKAGGRNNQGKP